MEEKSRQRTDAQNRAMHRWFKDVADTCLDNGVEITHIIKPGFHTQVDEYFIKWLYRKIGIKKKYIKKSTKEQNTKHPSLIYDEMVKHFANEVEPKIELPPFPCMENQTIEQYENYIENTEKAKSL